MDKFGYSSSGNRFWRTVGNDRGIPYLCPMQEESSATASRNTVVLPQLVRYLITGVATFGIEYSLLLTLVEVFQLNYQYANTIAFVLANLFNYLLSRYWVFTRGKHQTHIEMIAYFLGAGVGLLINVLVMGALVEYLSLDYRIAKIFAIGAIVVWNFWSRKKLIFKG